jgi:uncharacterized protein (TIGR03067 family)
MRPLAFVLIAGLSVAAVGCGGGLAFQGEKRAGPAAGLSPDLTAMQGTWAIDKLEQVGLSYRTPDRTASRSTVRKPDTRPAGPIPAEVITKVEAVVRGSQLTLYPEGKGSESVTAALTLDTSKTPKQIDMTLVDEKGNVVPTRYSTTGKNPVVTEDKTRPMTQFRGVYKFEGETLVIAMCTESHGPRPTEFKPAAPNRSPYPEKETGVIVIHLKKKK